MPLLKLENVSVNYGAIQAVRNISLEVQRGEIVTLIGANGAGKTTILCSISRMLKVREGSIHFDGKEITRICPGQGCPDGNRPVPRRKTGPGPPERPGQSRAGRLCPQGPPGDSAGYQSHVRSFSHPGQTGGAAGRNAFGRRTADACHGAGADEPSRSSCFSTSRAWGWPRSSCSIFSRSSKN